MGIYSVGEGDVKEERRRPSQTLVVLPAFSAILEMTKDRELFCSLNSSFSSLRALRVATWCKCEQQYWSRSLRTTPCYRNLKKDTSCCIFSSLSSIAAFSRPPALSWNISCEIDPKLKIQSLINILLLCSCQLLFKVHPHQHCFSQLPPGVLQLNPVHYVFEQSICQLSGKIHHANSISYLGINLIS